MFEELKSKIQIIIKKSNDREINKNSENKDIGIYMIYIDNFDDDKIIPFYIGQTGCGKNRNFQNRYNEHLQELMALNRLKFDYYKMVLLSNFYDGYYKTCKIFQYMIDHNCTFKDFHMIVLEEIEPENDNLQELLDKKEQEYFSKYLPAFFGFNQINTVTESVKDFFASVKDRRRYVKSDKVLKYELEDCENFIKFFGFGYTKFNYYHCYPKSHIVSENDKEISYELKEKKELLKRKYYDENKFKKYLDKLPKLEKQKEEVEKYINYYENLFEQDYAPKIRKYCEENDIGIMQKYTDIVNMVNYQTENNISAFKKYLKRKKINVNILDVFNQDNEFINLRYKYVECIKNKEELNEKINECRYIKRTDDLLRILPKKEYDLFPLKDTYQEIKFEDLEDNSVIINFEFSNHGAPANSWDYWPCDIIKMDYKLNIDNKIIEKKNIFIKPQELEEDDDYEMNYFEKDVLYKNFFHKNPFSVRNFSGYISTTMESQNGINEFTLINKEKIDLETILDEINLLINEQTKVKVEVRKRMKKKLKEVIKEYYESDNILKNKILALK